MADETRDEALESPELATALERVRRRAIPFLTREALPEGLVVEGVVPVPTPEAATMAAISLGSPTGSRRPSRGVNRLFARRRGTDRGAFDVPERGNASESDLVAEGARLGAPSVPERNVTRRLSSRPATNAPVFDAPPEMPAPRIAQRFPSPFSTGPKPRALVREEKGPRVIVREEGGTGLAEPSERSTPEDVPFSGPFAASLTRFGGAIPSSPFAGHVDETAAIRPNPFGGVIAGVRRWTAAGTLAPRALDELRRTTTQRSPSMGEPLPTSRSEGRTVVHVDRIEIHVEQLADIGEIEAFNRRLGDALREERFRLGL